MYQKALSIYYFLTMFVLGTALFAMQPTQLPEVATWQNNIKDQFSVAWKQTMGDQPWLDDVSFVYDSINSFYKQSANATIAMISDPDSDADIAYVYGQVYNDFALALKQRPNPNATTAYNTIEQTMPDNYMKEAPLYNLIPENDNKVSSNLNPAVVSAASIDGQMQKPVNTLQMPWVTISDAATGQIYCLAVYNGTVNKYLGECQYDYH